MPRNCSAAAASPFPSRVAAFPSPAVAQPMDLPVVDLAPYLQIIGGPTLAEEGVHALCEAVSDNLRDTRALLVKDPRCSAADNDRFLDVVERYFARSDDARRLQERPHLHYQELNSEPVIPDGLPEWKETMDSWGFKMISAIEVVAEMAAFGFGLPKDEFTSLMKEGPHLLAPTGSH